MKDNFTQCFEIDKYKMAVLYIHAAGTWFGMPSRYKLSF